MINVKTTRKYEYSRKREMELLLISNQIFLINNPKSYDEIFKVELDEYPFVEEFYIRTCLLLLFKYGYIDNSGDYVESVGEIGSSLVDINIKYSGNIVKNIKEFYFDDFYITILLNNDGEISNMIGLNDILVEILNIRRDSKSKMKTDIKKYLNSIFGMLCHSKGYIKPNIDMSNIVTRGANIMNRIKGEFIGHFIYIDTDTIFFNNFMEIEERFNSYMDKLKDKYNLLSFSLIDHSNGIFIRKKKYILYKGEIYTRGLRVV